MLRTLWGGGLWLRSGSQEKKTKTKKASFRCFVQGYDSKTTCVWSKGVGANKGNELLFKPMDTSQPMPKEDKRASKF